MLAHSAARSLDALFVFDTHLAVTGREGGARRQAQRAARGEVAVGDGAARAGEPRGLARVRVREFGLGIGLGLRQGLEYRCGVRLDLVT